MTSNPQFEPPWAIDSRGKYGVLWEFGEENPWLGLAGM